MKKLLSVLFVLILLLTTAGAALADGYLEYSQPRPGTTLPRQVSLREAPDESSRRYKYLANNAKFDVVGEIGEWYVISYPEAPSGVAYALKQYIVLNPVWIKILSGTPVYASPRLKNPAIGYVSANSTFVLLEEEYDNCYVVNLRTAAGYIPKKVPFSVQNDVPDYYHYFVPSEGTVVNTNGLNIRIGPGSGYPSIGKLKKGTTVEIVDVVGEWCVILYTYRNKEIAAYVHSDYIQY